MAREKGDLQHTDKGKLVGKQQLYALHPGCPGTYREVKKHGK